MGAHKPDMGEGKGKINCPQCGRPVVPPAHVGSLTTYLFQGFHCSCDKTLKAIKSQDARPESKNTGVEFCPRCGLARGDKSKIGSITGYLFQDIRCHCSEGEIFDSASMSQKFWKLKEEGKSPDFSRGQSAFASTEGRHVDLAEGAIIAGVYRIIRLVGRGGMGEVYLVEHVSLGKRSALKVIPPDKVTEVGWQRFQTEARLFARLDHINLVRVTDLGIHDGCLPFYAMDFVQGQTLADLLAEGGPLNLGLAIEIFEQVCDGVDFAHRSGIIHRDLKPANIMISRSERSGKMTVKILDFGLAKLTQRDRSQQSLTAVGEVFGSPFYMSPEQCRGEKIDNRSDIYSIGCTIFESLTGRAPFYGSGAMAIMNAHQSGDPPTLESVVGPRQFPDAMEVVVAKLMRKNPAERYQTMAELKGDLEKVARGENVAPIYVSRAKGTVLAQGDDQSQLESEAPGPNKALRIIVVGGLLTFVIVTGVAVTTLMRGSGSAAVKWHGKARAGDQVAVPLGAKAREFPSGQAAIDATLLAPLSPPSPSSYYASKLVPWDGKPFYKGIVKRSGASFKLWEFPRSSGVSLGSLVKLDPDSCPASRLPAIGAINQWEMVGERGRLNPVPHLPLIGAMTAPISVRVALLPNPEMLESPDLFNGFSDGNFDSLILDGLSATEFDKFGVVMARLQSIDGLIIGYFIGDSSVGDHCLKVINQYPNLTRLTVALNLDGRSLSQIRRLKMLELLALVRVTDDSDDVTAALRGSTNLRQLYLRDFPVSSSTFRDIGTCANLEALSLRKFEKEVKISGYQLAGLGKLKKLSFLQLEAISYSPALIHALSQCHSLKVLKCELDCNWSREQRMALREALPSAEMLVTWPDSAGNLRQLHIMPSH